MQSHWVDRRRMAVAGGAVLMAVGALTGCGTSGNQAPSTTPTTTTTTTTTTATPPPSSAAPAPTEKSINPTGGNLFTPGVLAPPAPTEPPGVHRNNK
jgi:hypothetical protein